MQDILKTIIKETGAQLNEGPAKDILGIVNKMLTFQPYVGIFGETGNGKSSLCNGLFGQHVAEVSHHASCTRDIQAIKVPHGDIMLLDIPGIAEHGKTEEYLDLYHELCTQGYEQPNGTRVPLDLAIWAIPASTRAYNDAQIGTQILRNSGIPLIVVLTKADDIDDGEWDYTHHQPDGIQLDYLEKRRHFASQQLDIPISQIVGCSADQKWNLDTVVETMLNVLPDQKRAAVAKSIRPDLRSQRVQDNVEKGLLDTLGDFIKDNPQLITTIISIVISVIFKVKKPTL